MNEAQDWYDKVKANSATDNKERIKQVLQAGHLELQTVLQLKMNCLALEDAEHFCFRGKDEWGNEHYGFNEKLVNRLMHLAYLYGCKDIEQTSFDSGYYSCRKDITEDLKELYETYGTDNE